jgi:enoyl-CoA hydratase/carnithine racemase
MPDYAEILYVRDGPVAVITLNRPAARNALTDLTQAEVRHALGASEREPEVIGTVLTGAGRGFCSGVDMNALGAMSEAGRVLSRSYEHLKATPGNPLDDPNYKWSPAYFLGLRKPLIAAVNGACAGLGFSYATFCDMRFMARGARVVTSFSPRGLVAEHGTSWLLPRLVGPSNALDMVWSSRRIEAEEAWRMGWANRLCEPGESAKDAVDYLKEIARSAAPTSLMMMKRQVWRHLNRDLAEAMRESTAWTEESLQRPDFKEGVASFVEKRPPRFATVSADE